MEFTNPDVDVDLINSVLQLGLPPCTEKIEACSRVLSAGSPVFRAMLEGPLSPLSQGRLITITDIDPRAFEILIRWADWLILGGSFAVSLLHIKILKQISDAYLVSLQ